MFLRILALVPLLLATPGSFGQTSFPMITHVAPVAVQRGRASDVTVEGQMNFAGVYKVIVEGRGVSGDVLPATPPAKGKAPAGPVRNVRLRVQVAADAPLGVREFRLASGLGISSLGQLLVVDDPVVAEAADNNSTDKSQSVPLPCVVSGRIEAAEDSDCFRFKARQGQHLTFDVHCARLQDKIHDLQKHADPLLTLFDGAGRELAASDDVTFADPLLSFTIPKDGDYVIQVRDARFDGDPRWVYALHITDAPRVAQVYPLAANPGQALELIPVGSARQLAGKFPFKAPADVGIHTVAFAVAGRDTNPTAFVVSPLPLALEQEPNDSVVRANKLPIPGGVNGRIGQRRDLDHFTFRGVKGRAIQFEVFARRFGTELNSQLDGIIEVLNAAGAVLATNDDANGKDPALVFVPAADGEYTLRLRDLNSKGGDGFVYFLAADWAKPSFTLKCDPSIAMIGPGSRAAWFVHVTRINGFTGPVKVQVTGLPNGVTASALTIPPTMTQGLVVVSAANDAAVAAGAVQVSGSADITFEGQTQTVTQPAAAVAEIYLPGGGRGRFDARMQAVAVTDKSDIVAVQVKPERLVLKPGDEVKLDVTIERRADYDKAVSLDVPLRHLGQVYGNPLPPGVTIVDGKSKTLLGTGNSGYVTLKVDAGAAAIDDVPICVLAHVSINFVVKISYASKPMLLTIKK